MYVTVFIVFGMILVVLSPVIWVGWWLLAGLGSRADGTYRDVHESAGHGYQRAA